ncbi:MAG: hypothetical protein ACOY4A_07215 [Pseudomonadota bacterium]
MKVQMQGQRLRFRIDEAELAALQAGQTVKNMTCTPGGSQRQSVALSDAAGPVFGPGMHLALPRDLLESYAQRLPCRDALVIRLPLDGGDMLQVDFEVDVRDSVRSRGHRAPVT